MTKLRINERDLADLVIKPIVTEKAKKATKPEIKAAIESLFDVAVEKVNTINPPRKKRRVGRFIGFKPQYKKAIVTLKEGESLQEAFFPEL